jgi:hypothetical protein
MQMGDHTWIISGVQFLGYSAISFLESKALRREIGRRYA